MVLMSDENKMLRGCVVLELEIGIFLFYWDAIFRLPFCSTMPICKNRISSPLVLHFYAFIAFDLSVIVASATL